MTYRLKADLPITYIGIPIVEPAGAPVARASGAAGQGKHLYMLSDIQGLKELAGKDDSPNWRNVFVGEEMVEEG